MLSKSIADFDWQWPKVVDREQIEDPLQLGFVGERANVVLFGPTGTGKTMVAQNLGHQALQDGHTALMTTASAMLNDLAAQDSAAGLARRLRRYCRPRLLLLDEIGYFVHTGRAADLFFEVISGPRAQIRAPSGAGDRTAQPNGRRPPPTRWHLLACLGGLGRLPQAHLLRLGALREAGAGGAAARRCRVQRRRARATRAAAVTASAAPRSCAAVPRARRVTACAARCRARRSRQITARR